LLLQKSNLTFGGVAVAFLMFVFVSGLYDTDNCHDDVDNRHDNTGSSQNVLILAKGEPLTVLVAPINIIS